MRDPTRIDRMLALLGSAWKANPDMRLGQLVVALGSGLTAAWPDVFHVEDGAMERALEKWIAEDVKRARAGRPRRGTP